MKLSLVAVLVRAANLFACSSYFFASLVVDLQTYLLVSFAKNKLLV